MTLGGISVMRRPAPTASAARTAPGSTGDSKRGYEVLVEMDSDLSHDPLVLPELLHAVAAGDDSPSGPDTSRVVAPRLAVAAPHDLPQRLPLHAETMLRLPAADSTSGFRAYRAAALRAVDLDAVQASGYGFQVEMTYRVARTGGRVAEVPIEFRDPCCRHLEDVDAHRGGGLPPRHPLGTAGPVRSRR